MGKTNPTYRGQIKTYKDRWSSYRRGLRHQDKQHYDNLWKYVDDNADAAGYMNPRNPFKAMLISMLLEHEKQLQELKQK